MVERRVRTPGGVRHFDQPIGTLIVKDPPIPRLPAGMKRAVPPSGTSQKQRDQVRDMTPTMRRATHSIADALTVLEDDDQHAAITDVAEVAAGRLARRLPDFPEQRRLVQLGQDAEKRLAGRTRLRLRLRELQDRITDWVAEVQGSTPGIGSAPTVVGLPNPFTDPLGFVTGAGQMLTHWLEMLARGLGLTAGGQSWRWQLRDSRGQWVEMGAQVKWLERGRWALGRVTGSPSPGMAEVDQGIGGPRTLASARLTVIEDTTWKTSEEFVRETTETIRQSIVETWPDIKDLDVSVSFPDSDDSNHIWLTFGGTTPDGKSLYGNIERAWIETKDTVVNVHFTVDKEHQGQGLGTHVTKNLDDLYRRRGIKRITVDANMNVGGYAWAVRGFDFTDRGTAARLLGALARTYHIEPDPDPAISELIDDPYALAVSDQIDVLIDRADRGERITPLEIAMIGYPPKDKWAKTWPGKKFMLSQSWDGVKWLQSAKQPAMGVAAAAGGSMTTDEFLVEVDRLIRDWEPTAVAGATPDPQYADDDPTQYAENVVIVSPSPEDEARLWEEITRLLSRYRPQPPRQRRAVLAGGDSWRWQLRDKNGKWIEMGAEVRYLVRGLYRQGIVIGSPSPGIAKVREHITDIVRDIPSNRLQVVESAERVVERAASKGGWKQAGITTANPALVDLVKRSKEGEASLQDFGEYLLPEEFGPLRGEVVDLISVLHEVGALGVPWSPKAGEHVWSKIKPHAKALGFSDVEGKALSRAIAIRIRESIERQKVWDNTFDDAKKIPAYRLNEIRRTGQVATAATLDTAVDIMESGRFKSQFETGYSQGMYEPNIRAAYETAMAGMHPKINKRKRTIYGFMFTPGHEFTDSTEQYGETVRFVFKPEVRARSTVTVGDSLSTGAVPVPIDGTDVDTRQGFMAMAMLPGTRMDLATEDIGGFQEQNYFEVQIHDGVKRSDIQEIVIKTQYLAMADTRVMRLQELALQYGIPIRYVA